MLHFNILFIVLTVQKLVLLFVMGYDMKNEDFVCRDEQHLAEKYFKFSTFCGAD